MSDDKRTEEITHEIYCLDTGRLICTLPTKKGGLEPKYRVIKVKVKK